MNLDHADVSIAAVEDELAPLGAAHVLGDHRHPQPLEQALRQSHVLAPAMVVML